MCPVKAVNMSMIGRLYFAQTAFTAAAAGLVL
jgi:hypothetical protein